MMFCVNSKVSRQRNVLARYQFLLDVSIWHMLHNCVCLVEGNMQHFGEDAEESVYVDDECMVCSRLCEYTQVQAAGTSESESEHESSDDAASLFSRSLGSCVGNLGDLDDVQFDALVNHDMKFDDSFNGDGVTVVNGDCATGAALLQKGDSGDLHEVTETLPVLVQHSEGEDSNSVCSADVKPNVMDSTVDVDGNDFQDTRLEEDVSDSKLFGVRGPKSKSILEPHDCYQLVRIARDIPCREPTGGVSQLLFRRGLKEEADFVPDEVFDMLLSNFEDLFQLSRILQLDWVRTWSGWEEMRSNLDACNDDALKNMCVEML